MTTVLSVIMMIVIIVSAIVILWSVYKNKTTFGKILALIFGAFVMGINVLIYNYIPK